MKNRFQVVETGSGYYLEDTKTGKTHWLSDGVDVFDDLEVGTEEFRIEWERSFNMNPEETYDAYFRTGDYDKYFKRKPVDK